MKKPLSRSQRGSKGIMGKHFLQICVLLGVCIWLIYQLKYSHDKKKEFYEKDGKKSMVKLGRKDLLPGYHNQKEKHVEEDEEDISNGGEEKESKSKVENDNHEEKEEEEEVEEDEEDKNKQGEEENKYEEDEIDEQDQSKTAGDTDKDDEFLEGEKENGSNEIGEKEDIDEAREEHYKADDASSAVSHESWIMNSEKLKESSGNSNETGQEKNSNAIMNEIEIQKEPVLKLGEAESGDFVEKTTITESQDETVNGNSTVAILEASGFLQNETQIMQDRSQEDGAPPAGTSDLQNVLVFEQTRNESNPTITVSANITNKDSFQDESRNSSSEFSLIKNISDSNTTEVKENSRSEDDDGSGEKESANLFSTDKTEEADDTSENSISQEEMEALTDPQTLPDIRIEENEDDEEEAIAAE